MNAFGQFETGDVVRLKSDRRAMIVLKQKGNSACICAWFDRNFMIQTCTFEDAVLERTPSVAECEKEEKEIVNEIRKKIDEREKDPLKHMRDSLFGVGGGR